TDRGWVLLFAVIFYLPLAAAIATRRSRTVVRVALVWATVPLVLLGVVIWGAALVSSIPGLRWNGAVFVFVPFGVLLPVLGGESRRKYAQIRAGMVVWASLLCVVGIFKQPLWIPILVAFVPHALVAWIDPMLAAAKARKGADVDAGGKAAKAEKS